MIQEIIYRRQRFVLIHGTDRILERKSKNNCRHTKENGCISGRLTRSATRTRAQRHMEDH